MARATRRCPSTTCLVRWLTRTCSIQPTWSRTPASACCWAFGWMRQFDGLASSWSGPWRRSRRSRAPGRRGGCGRARHVQVVAPLDVAGQSRHRTPVREAEQKDCGAARPVGPPTIRVACPGWMSHEPRPPAWASRERIAVRRRPGISVGRSRPSWRWPEPARSSGRSWTSAAAPGSMPSWLLSSGSRPRASTRLPRPSPSRGGRPQSAGSRCGFVVG